MRRTTTTTDSSYGRKIAKILKVTTPCLESLFKTKILAFIANSSTACKTKPLHRLQIQMKVEAQLAKERTPIVM